MSELLGKHTKKRQLCTAQQQLFIEVIFSTQLLEMLTEEWWKTVALLICLHIHCHCSMKVFVTKYNFTGFVPDQNSYNGLTLRRNQIGNPRRLEQITLCFRVKLEYFLLMGQHSPLLDLLDGRWRLGGRCQGGGEQAEAA